METLGRPHIVDDIVEEHFDELDWLWEFREANVYTPDWTLADLEEHEERAEAHLDGLRLAELHGIELAIERLKGDEPSEVTAATFVLWDADQSECYELISSVIGGGTDVATAGVAAALRHRPIDRLSDLLRGLGKSENRFRAATVVDLLSFHRQDCGNLRTLLTSDDSEVQVMAFRAAGRLGVLQEGDLRKGLETDTPAVRRVALEAAARCGIGSLRTICRTRASLEKPDPEALRFLGVLGDPSDVALLIERTGGRQGMVATAALGAAGRVEAVPRLIELMANEELGLEATAAYKRITNAPDVEGELPFPPAPILEGEDEDDALPPDPQKAAADWAQRRKRMTPEARWQSGIPFPEGELTPEAHALPLQSRRDLYLSARARGGSSVADIELESTVRRQRQAIQSSVQR